MNFWIFLLWALFGLPGLFIGIALWKRNPVILDARKYQRLYIVIACIVFPSSFLAGSSLFFEDSFHWIWSVLIFVGLVAFLLWHTNQKLRAVSFFNFEKEEFIDALETALKKTRAIVTGKPEGRFVFFRQYRTAHQKICLQVEYSRWLSRFTVRFFRRQLPTHFDNKWIQKMASLSINRSFNRVPFACVYYLSTGVGWIVIFVWLAIVSV
jgi:hypothetical protein